MLPKGLGSNGFVFANVAAVSGLGADHGVGFDADPDFMYLLILNNLSALVRNPFL
jgi:hypothetical protein